MIVIDTDTSASNDQALEPPPAHQTLSVSPPGMERRTFLKLAAAGAALVAGGQVATMLGLLERVSASDLPVTGAAAAHQWVFIIDLRRCDGCAECTTACQREHFLPADQEWIRVHRLTDASGGDYFLPVMCQMCERPPCVQVCPVTATYRTDDGPIAIDQSVCIGCRMCMAACPYGVRTFNWQEPVDVPEEARHDGPDLQIPQVQGTVGKCDNCAHLAREGELPACVRDCAMEAVYIGDLVTDVATNGRQTVGLSQYLREHDVYRLKEHLGTEPRVYYVAGHGQDLDY
jgi:molybdopterin-containing oxidoreductase family iron-sulfur binding subunit